MQSLLAMCVTMNLLALANHDPIKTRAYNPIVGKLPSIDLSATKS